MGLLDRFRSTGSDVNTDGQESAPAGNASDLPIEGYDGLDPREVSEKLHELSQAELEEVEDYERAHKERPVILNKLRFMRSSQPFDGYDDMSPEQVNQQLAGSDSRDVKAVRDYERKFRGRREIMDEAARVLPEASENAGEAKSREEKSARVRESMRKRN